MADCDLREEVLISRTGNLFVRFAIGTIVDVDGISYEVGLQYSLDGHTYVKAAGGTFIKCDKNIAGVDKGDNHVEELDTSCYYYEEVISS